MNRIIPFKLTDWVPLQALHFVDNSSRFDSNGLSNQSDLNELVHSSDSPFIVSLDRDLATQGYEPDDNSPNYMYCANCKPKALYRL